MENQLIAILSEMELAPPVYIIEPDGMLDKYKSVAPDELAKYPGYIALIVKRAGEDLQTITKNRPLLFSNFVKDKGELWFGYGLNRLKGSQYLSKYEYDDLSEAAQCDEFAVFFDLNIGFNGNVFAHELAHHIDMAGTNRRFSRSELFQFCIGWDKMLNPKGVSSLIEKMRQERGHANYAVEENFAIMVELYTNGGTLPPAPLLQAFMQLVDVDLEYQSQFTSTVFERADFPQRMVSRPLSEIICQTAIKILNEVVEVIDAAAKAQDPVSKGVYEEKLEVLKSRFQAQAATDISSYAAKMREELLGQMHRNVIRVENFKPGVFVVV